ncbi:MAG: hypothetical protein IKW83_05220 [Muribaculaceae bacterium]|nr:hypothetical protein [Muribaculaceae bacterium]
MVATTVYSAIGAAHWERGKLLHDKKVESKQGSDVVNYLSNDSKQSYPHMRVSPRNLWDMKKLYERFCDREPIDVAVYLLIVPQEELKKVVAEELEVFGKELPLSSEIESNLKTITMTIQQRIICVRKKELEQTLLKKVLCEAWGDRSI